MNGDDLKQYVVPICLHCSMLLQSGSETNALPISFCFLLCVSCFTALKGVVIAHLINNLLSNLFLHDCSVLAESICFEYFLGISLGLSFICPAVVFNVASTLLPDFVPCTICRVLPYGGTVT